MEYKKKIDSLVEDKNEMKLKTLLEKIYKYRQAGLDSRGELSEENIVFKMLRAKGQLDKLKDGISDIYDQKMSVKEIAMNKSEYEQDVEDAAYKILSYAKLHKKYPDINSYIEDISLRYGKNDDHVYSDIARIFSQISK